MSDPNQPTPANDSGAPGGNGAGGGQPGEAGLPLFYKNPEPLDPNRFGGWGLDRAKFTAAFSATTHAVPLSLTEFHLAAKHFPIVFTPGETPMPLAALGLNREENLFVDDQGNWAEDTYVPAYIRRYPFVLAEIEQEKRMLLCVEREAVMVTSEKPDMPFFDGDQATDVTKQALDLCKQFHDDLTVTRNFMTEAKGMGLTKETELKYTAPDGKEVVAGRFITFDGEALEKLPDDKFLDLRRRNMLAAVFLQSTSQTNWGRLAQRKQKKLQDAAQTGSA